MTTARTVAFLGGNGHCSARLDGARRAIDDHGIALRVVEIAYPGFEGRARAPSFDAFLASVDGQLAASGATLAYASGIAALFALALRARQCARDVAFILQGPVLWGLETRWMPRLLRRLPAERVLRAAFGLRAYQRHFAEKQFRRALGDAELDAFFAGYAACAALGDLFDWLTPALLRELEAAFATDNAGLDHLEVWCGAHDHVVDAREIALTERALGVELRVERFADWGHYPMIDDPVGWARRLSGATSFGPRRSGSSTS